MKFYNISPVKEYSSYARPFFLGRYLNSKSQCAAALARVGIGRVFFGCRNDKFGGCGSLMKLHDASTVPSGEYHGYPIVEGILKDEAVRLLRSFYDRENFHAPDDKRKRKPPPNGEDVDT